jgi:undecaprenyl-diphosphatase
MLWLQAVILGIVQGITEFLPISSSAHLVLVPSLLGWAYFGKTFDVATHIGTLIAIIAFTWTDLRGLFQRDGSPFMASIGRGRFVMLLMASAIPAGIVGKLFDDRIEALTTPEHNPNAYFIIAGTLIGFGLLLGLAERMGRQSRGEEAFPQAAIAMGLAQMQALIPGVSRSGITMTAGLMLGVRRDLVARFSFLISLPITAAVALYKILQVARDPSAMLHGIPGGSMSTAWMVYGLAIVASAISGYLAMRFLVRFLNQHTFYGFVIYRVALGLFLIYWGLTVSAR